MSDRAKLIVAIDEHLHDSAHAAAEDEGIRLSVWIERAIQQKLARDSMERAFARAAEFEAWEKTKGDT